MRVHLLITDLEIGGTPRVVKGLAIRLRPLGFETAVACLSPWGPVADELTAAGIPLTAFDARGPRDLRRTVARARAWAADADVLFSFLVHANLVATLARRSPTRLIQSVQTTQPYPAWHWWLQAWLNRSAECVVVPSASVAAKASEMMPPRHVRVIPNAVQPEQFAAADSRRRPGPYRVGFVGRLDPVKCVPDLVRAVARLSDAELHLYGEGPAEAGIRQAAIDSGLAQRLILHGRVASATDALSAIDVLVLPSAAEGFGLVLIEAMAAGVPVVATRVPGIVDVVRDGENGLLVPPHAPPAIADAIERLQHDDTLRAKLVEGGYRDVQRQYTWASVLPMYEQLLRGRSNAPTLSTGIAGRRLEGFRP